MSCAKKKSYLQHEHSLRVLEHSLRDLENHYLKLFDLLPWEHTA